MKKKEKKENKKNMIKIVKLLTIILAVLLISVVGFAGIYVQNKNQMTNILKEYSLSMALNGARTIKLEIEEEDDDDASEEETIEDETVEETETTTEETSEETTETNNIDAYKKSKKVIEKRLASLGVQEYIIRLDETTGAMEIEIPENSDTDDVVSILSEGGKFEIIDTETEEVLMTNDDIKSSSVLYNTTTSGTTVYLQIKFNKEGKQKLKEISETYVEVEEDSADEETEENETTESDETATEEETDDSVELITSEDEDTEEDSEETTTEKTITMKVDDEEIMTTSFDEVIANGEIDLSVGSATTDTETLEGYVEQAKEIATILDSGNLEFDYETTENEYILSNISQKNLICVAIAVAIIVAIGIIVLTIKFKLNGLLAGIAYIGLAAIYAIILRYTNVVISIESIVGAIIMLVLNYIFVWIFLKNVKANIDAKKEKAVKKAAAETYIQYFLKIIPICIMVIALCFVKCVPINSFAMTSFWGLVMIALYNVIITKNLISIKENK